MLKMNVSQMPFTRRNSYMAISRLGENYKRLGNKEGLYLRTIHGSANTPLIAQITMTENGQEKEYGYRLEHTALIFEEKGSKIEICFGDPDTLLIRGTGKAGLHMDFLTDSGAYDYIYTIPCGNRKLYMANCYKNNCRYLIWAQEGEILLDQQWKESTALYSRLSCKGPEGFLMILREIKTEWDRECKAYDYDQARDKTEREFLAFKETMPDIPGRYEDELTMGAYLNWSSIVAAESLLKRDSMYMSKNWMCNVWSWDHCFNAIVLSYKNPQLAWDQFMVMFDFQDPSGRLPDSVNDVKMIWNYCKPPIHGWALSKMMEHMELSQEQIEEAYDCLDRWTGWWLTYRDRKGQGLCVYNHGNDSGWDNSTAFSVIPPVITPELQADLILQMEVLADLAGRLDKKEEQAKWEQASQDMMEQFLQICFRENLPVALQSATGEEVENNSLLPYEALVLGKRLPEEKRTAMVKVLKSDKFYTEYGFATESPASPLYRSDGYWRGPIWAPSTMLLLDGLAQCGEHALAREAAEKFANMVAKSGFAENFDALTGEGLRDRAYTWTASVFLILAHEYLL